jgi:hypothetical protein
MTAQEKGPRYSITAFVWQGCFAAILVYWLLRLPEPGYAVTILGVAAVVMAVRAAKFSRGEEIAWIIIAIALCVVEIRAIRHDRDVAANDQAEVRKREEENFRTIASGLQKSIDNSQTQFAATMSQAKAILAKTQSVSTLTERNLQNITGGESFAFVRPQVEAAGKGPIGLVVWNHGNEVLTGVTVAFSRTNDPNWGSEFFNRFVVGTIAPHDGAMIPVTLTPQLGDNGIDHYWLMVSAQNGTVDETLDFRESKKLPGTFAVRLAVTRRFKIDKSSSASIPVLIRDWTDESGADQTLPNVNASLKLLKREAKKRH